MRTVNRALLFSVGSTLPFTAQADIFTTGGGSWTTEANKLLSSLFGKTDNHHGQERERTATSTINEVKTSIAKTIAVRSSSALPRLRGVVTKDVAKKILHSFGAHHIPQEKKSHASIVIMKGFVEGFGAHTPKDECIDSVEEMATEVDTAIDDFKKRTTEGMLDGLKELAEAFADALPDAMARCDDTKTEIKEILKVLEKFKTMKELVYHFGEDLVINGASIYADVNSAIAAYEQKDYERFGQKVGDAFQKAVIGAPGDDPPHPPPHHPKMSSQQIELLETVHKNLKKHHSIDLVKGFVEGFGANAPADECITESEKIATNMDQIIADFEKATPQAIMEAITLLNDTYYKELPEVTKECEETKEEVNEILKELEKFKTPSEFIYHIEQDLIINGISIYADVEAAMSAYKSGDYEGAGQKFGDAVHKTVIGDSSKPPNKSSTGLRVEDLEM